MDPITMMAIAQGIPALLQAGTGIGQFITGNKARKDLVRPEYEIPLAQRAALGQARSLASSQEMAGMSEAENEMNQILAMGIQAANQTAGSSSEALGAATNMFANRMRQQNSLAGQAAQDFQRRQQNVTGQLNNMSAFQDKQWQLNEMQPFQDAAATASAMGGAGMQNMMGGIKGLGGAIGGAYANKALMDALGGTKVEMQGAAAGMPAMPPQTPSYMPEKTAGTAAVNDLGSTLTGATYLSDPYIGYGKEASKLQAIMDLVMKNSGILNIGG